MGHGGGADCWWKGLLRTGEVLSIRYSHFRGVVDAKIVLTHLLAMILQKGGQREVIMLYCPIATLLLRRAASTAQVGFARASRRLVRPPMVKKRRLAHNATRRRRLHTLQYSTWGIQEGLALLAETYLSATTTAIVAVFVAALKASLV